MNLLAIALAVTLAAPAMPAQAAPHYQVVDHIAGPDGGWDLLSVDPATHRLLVAHGDSVMAVDLATKAVTPGLSPGAGLHDVISVNGGREMLVTSAGASAAIFADAITGATLATVKTGAGPDAEVFDPASGLVLVMDHRAGDITLIDPRTHQAVGSVVVGGDLELAAVDGAGRAFVNVENKNEIAVVDIKARKVVARYPLPGCDGPTGLAYDAADRQLIAACDGASVLVSATTGKVLATLATGAGADGVVFDAQRRLAFVPAGRAGALAVVSVSKGAAAIVETVPTRFGARTLALDPASGRLYLPSAQFGPLAAGARRPPMIPGTFEILVVAP